MSRVRHILLVAMLVMAFASCQRRPLVEEDLGVILKLELDYDIPHYIGAKSTQYMQVSFYNLQTERLHSIDMTGTEGGRLSVPAGDYKMLIHNTGTDATRIRGEEFYNTTEAYTNDISRFMLGTLKGYLSTRQELLNLKSIDGDINGGTSSDRDEGNEESRPTIDERIVYTPNHLFVARNDAVHIPVRIAGDAPVVIEATARSVVESWLLEIHKVSGIENISEITALITGMVGSNLISRDIRTEESVTIYEKMTADAATNTLTTIFNTFGKQPDEYNILSVVITDIAGGQYQYNFDISEQFIDNPERRITITTDIHIPKPEYGGGGFKPSVDDWDEEQTDIEL